MSFSKEREESYYTTGARGRGLYNQAGWDEVEEEGDE